MRTLGDEVADHGYFYYKKNPLFYKKINSKIKILIFLKYDP